MCPQIRRQQRGRPTDTVTNGAEEEEDGVSIIISNSVTFIWVLPRRQSTRRRLRSGKSLKNDHDRICSQLRARLAGPVALIIDRF